MNNSQPHRNESKLVSIKFHQYPMLTCFGKTRLLSPQEAVRSTPEQRIESIWPFVARTVLRFCSSLRAFEMVNYDPDDVMVECWIEIRRQDVKWKPSSGKYITFVGIILNKFLIRVREEAQVVRAARNVMQRINQGDKLIEEGKLSPKKMWTVEALKRSTEPAACIDELSEGSDYLLENVNKHSLLPIADKLVSRAIEVLDVREAMVIGEIMKATTRKKPLSARNIRGISRRTGISIHDVYRLRDTAYEKMRNFIAENKQDEMDDIIYG
jgi:DNA-directed RNA polymerase specialized sigma subunit